MRRTFIFLLLCFLIFSITQARSLDISIDKTEVSANSEITIAYSIQFDEEETFTYQVGVKGNESIVLLNETITSDKAEGEIVWNTKNYPAGEYEAYIFIYPTTYWPSRKFEILPFMDFKIDFQKLDIFVYKNSITKAFEIKNTGNIPLFASLSLKGLKSEASLTPITSKIGVNKSASFLFSVEKPDKTYNATLTIELSGGDEYQEVEIPITIYNPFVLIEAKNITLERTANSQIVKGEIYNKGNVYRNITLIFNLEDREEKQEIVLYPNKTFELNQTFPLNEKVNSLEIKYIGNEGKEEVIKQSFGVLPSIDLSNIKDNLPYLIVSIIFLIGILYVLFRKRKPKDVKFEEQSI